MFLLEVFWFSSRAYWDRLFSVRHSVLPYRSWELCLENLLQVDLPKRLHLTKGLEKWSDFIRKGGDHLPFRTSYIFSAIFLKIWKSVHMGHCHYARTKCGAAGMETASLVSVSVFCSSTLADKYKVLPALQVSCAAIIDGSQHRNKRAFLLTFPPSWSRWSSSDGFPVAFVVSKELNWRPRA